MMMRPVDAREAAAKAKLATQMIRLYNPDTGQFLHLSGQGATRDIHQSWLGFRRQADTLKRHATETGTSWPYHPVHRTLTDRPAEDV